MPRARCKFRITSVEKFEQSETIHLQAQYDPNDPEDTKFSEATPWGEFKAGISNPRLIGMFVLGDVYYVDLVPVEESAGAEV